jgi:hypothetical protein
MVNNPALKNRKSKPKKDEGEGLFIAWKKKKCTPSMRQGMRMK